MGLSDADGEAVTSSVCVNEDDAVDGGVTDGVAVEEGLALWVAV